MAKNPNTTLGSVGKKSVGEAVPVGAKKNLPLPRTPHPRHIAFPWPHPSRKATRKTAQKPRPSRGKSGKPPAPPMETAAQTPGLAEAPQAAFDSGQATELPALRNQKLHPSTGPAGLTAYLDALLAKPEQRSDNAKALLKQQPMLAAHPIVAGDQIEFTPHRPPRPEKSEGGKQLKLQSEFEPKGDQPGAIKELFNGINAAERDQVLLGVTGSGKTFTMAQVIERTQRPALILAPNKTLAAQLYGEFKGFFPEKRRRVLRVLLRLLSTGSLRSPNRYLHRKRKLD